MEKEILLQELKKISEHYFEKKDYISAGQINLAMDVVNDYDAVSPQENVNGRYDVYYWKQRCLLAEKCLEESPCDQDITADQIKAWNAYHKFISWAGNDR